ncbi:MAG: hypothetical protein GY862_03105 [Gammaproteobacteria bacterium]|nr:hypothetical protein [Gammaproteobacteria bacterium]
METIKTVRMVRQIRDAQYILTKDMSNEEFISYIRKKAKLANDQAYGFVKTNSKIESYAT